MWVTYISLLLFNFVLLFLKQRKKVGKNDTVGGMREGPKPTILNERQQRTLCEEMTRGKDSRAASSPLRTASRQCVHLLYQPLLGQPTPRIFLYPQPTHFPSRQPISHSSWSSSLF